MSAATADAARLERGSPAYPARLRDRLGEDAPPALATLGDPALLRLPLTAVFASVRVPADLLLPAYDLARSLRDDGVPVIGGFHSPVERDCLDYLLRGRQPVVAAPARALEGMGLPPAWREAAAGGRLLLVSGVEAARRPSAALAVRRNRMVAALAARIHLVHASAGGRLHRLAAEALAWGTPVSCFVHPRNLDLLLMGVRPVDPGGPLP